MAVEATKKQLVDQIKDMQRADPHFSKAWADYCDWRLGSIRDPKLHDPSKLSGFLAFYHRGGAASAGGGRGGRGGAGSGGAGKGGSARSGAGAGGWDGPSRRPWAEAPAATAAASGGKGGDGAVDGGAAGPSLVEIVKSGQRASVHWRGAWQTYCALHGGGVNDPAKHDDAHIAGFIDYVGQAALTSLRGAAVAGRAPPGGQPGARGPAAAASPLAARRPVGSAAVGAKAALVDRIKALQRSDPTAVEAWWSHCDGSSNCGTRDPNRHDAASLEAFLAAHSSRAA